MKLTRDNAIAMHQKLVTFAMGHLDEEMLEKVMDNLEACRKVGETFESLDAELHKRLFAGVDENDVKEFYDTLSKIQGKTLEQIEAIDSLLRSRYPEIYAIHEKKMAVRVKLLIKEEDITIRTVDEKTFIKAILKAQPDTAMSSFYVLAPMFGKVADVKDDFNELDELLN